jgi:peptidoglycan hydrolase-like protein with peptidoglycan-binding domain
MFNCKRILLGSLGVMLLAGLVYTVPSTAHAASGCNTVAEGSTGSPNYQATWGNNCQVGLNDQSDFVLAVQAVINESGVLDGKSQLCPKEWLTQDGKFGSLTQGAVKCYQSKTPGLTVDGAVGKDTWSDLGYSLVTALKLNGNWRNYSVGGGDFFVARMYNADPYKWEVNKAPPGGTDHFCPMDTSATCVG